MKQFLLLTSILFVAIVGCERHHAGELTSPQGRPNASLQEQTARGGQESTQWDLVGLGTLALVVVTGLSAYLAWRTEKVFRKILKTLAHAQDRADEAGSVRTMITCIEQFQNLENQKRAKPVDAERYFELLWNLHFEEYQFFVRGFLPREVYALWVWVRYCGYHEDKAKSLLGMSEIDGWNHARQYLQDDEFAAFVGKWLDKPKLEKSNVWKIVTDHLSSIKARTSKA